MLEILSYSFFQHALLGSLFTAITCGIIGTYIVAKRLVFISGGVTHSSFGGIGLGLFMGWNPLFTALVFALSSALCVEWVSKRHAIREDSAIAAFWSLGMAIGVIFIFLTPGFTPNLTSYLFGNILLISSFDLFALGFLVIVLISLLLIYGKTILYVAFDRDFAHSQNIPVQLVEYGMMALVATSIVLSIHLVGIMLLMSLLTLPQIIMNNFTNSYFKITIGSILIGFLACLGGLFIAYEINVPTGACIIFTLVCLFFLAKGFVLLHQKTIK